MKRFTKQEQLLLCIVIALLLAGWATSAYRAAHPSMSVVTGSAKP